MAAVNGWPEGGPVANVSGWLEGGPAPVPDGFEAGGKARPPRNGAESFPEAERCRAKGCAARKARHGVGRCEEHFEALCGFYGHTPNRNREPTRWRRVRRALKARAKDADGIGGAGKAATPASAPDAASGPESGPDLVRRALANPVPVARAAWNADGIRQTLRRVYPFSLDRPADEPLSPWLAGSLVWSLTESGTDACADDVADLARAMLEGMRAIADPGLHGGNLLAAYLLTHPRRAEVFDVRDRASLPNFDREGAHLIGGVPDAFDEREGQPFLPGFEPNGGPLPHWLIGWFGATGGPISQGGRLPLALSIMVGGLARVAIADRDGHWRTIRIPHRLEHEERFGGAASLERWLWPDGWGSNRRARWRLIPEALDGLRRGMAGWLSIPGLGRVAVLAPSVIPKRRADPLVELTIRIPGRAARGARFDWPTFSRLAVRSAIRARAYLAAAAMMDRTARNGAALTREIPAPILSPDGEPVRRKGGAIVRSATEVAPNPAAHFVPWLSDADLARAVGYPEGANRKARQRAAAAFAALAGAGLIDLQEARGRFRIFGP